MHFIILGKEGSKLRQLEQETDCRIMVPARDLPSEIIKIVGPREGIEKAIHEIQLVSDKQVICFWHYRKAFKPSF